MSKTALKKNDIAFTKSQVIQARAFRKQTGDVSKLIFSVSLEDGTSAQFPQELSTLFQTFLDVIAKEGSATVTSLPEELTSSSAAKMLGISRPTLVKLVKESQIPFRMEGSHLRLKVSDLLVFKEKRANKQSKAFKDLTRLSDLLPLN
jgi:excisionase family DNA binding protein